MFDCRMVDLEICASDVPVFGAMLIAWPSLLGHGVGLAKSCVSVVDPHSQLHLNFLCVAKLPTEYYYS